MPTYDYQCGACANTYTVMHKISEKAPACPDCGSHEVRKLLSAPAIHGKAMNSKPIGCEAPAAFAGGGCGAGMCGHKH